MSYNERNVIFIIFLLVVATWSQSVDSSFTADTAQSSMVELDVDSSSNKETRIDTLPTVDPIPQPSMNSNTVEESKVQASETGLGDKPENTKPIVSILPLKGKGMDQELKELLMDEFMKYLKKAGTYEVTDDKMIGAALQQQALQMTGAIDESTIVEVGRLAGASHLISLVLKIKGKDSISISGKIYSTETGKLMHSASEMRNGDTYVTSKRILKNIAYVLSGKTTKDHQDYEAALAKELQEKKLSESSSQARFRIGVQSSFRYPINYFPELERGPVRNYYEQTAAVTDWKINEQNLDYGILLRGGIRINADWWGLVVLGVQQNVSTSSFSRAAYPVDTSMILGSSIIQLSGVNQVLSRNSRTENDIFAGGGFAYAFVQSNRLDVSLDMVFLGVRNQLNESGLDSSFSTSQMYENTNLLGMNNIYTQVIRSATLTGIGMGLDAGFTGVLHVSNSWGLELSGGVFVKNILSLNGNEESVLHEVQSNPAVYTVTDTTLRTDVSWIRGDFLGTGEYSRVGNPVNKATQPNGQEIVPVKTSRMTGEYRLRLGIFRQF